jgi:hypothetical protein
MATNQIVNTAINSRPGTKSTFPVQNLDEFAARASLVSAVHAVMQDTSYLEHRNVSIQRLVPCVPRNQNVEHERDSGVKEFRHSNHFIGDSLPVTW